MSSEYPTIDQARVARDGEYAVVSFEGFDLEPVRYHIGPSIAAMSDAEVLRQVQQGLAAADEARSVSDDAEPETNEVVALEIPPGSPQLEYLEDSETWVPRGDVVRCVLEGKESGEVIIRVDDRQLSLDAFGRMLSAMEGWGMRLTFMPAERIEDLPVIEVSEPPEPEDDEE